MKNCKVNNRIANHIFLTSFSLPFTIGCTHHYLRIQKSLPGGTEGYPAQTGLIHPPVCLSVRPSVRTCRLGIEREIAQA